MPGLKNRHPRAARRPQGTDATPLYHLTAAVALDAPPRPSDPGTRSRGRDAFPFSMAYSRSSNTSNSALLSDQIGMMTSARALKVVS